MSIAYFFIGADGSGKDSVRRGFNRFHGHRGFRMLAYDDDIKKTAKRENTSTELVYKRDYEAVKKLVHQMSEVAYRTKQKVMWDTDDMMTAEQRKPYLEKIPSDYKKVAIFFTTQPNDPMITKRVPDQSVFEEPSLKEGFDEVRDYSFKVGEQIKVADAP
jgi:hypothetical protein